MSMRAGEEAKKLSVWIDKLKAEKIELTDQLKQRDETIKQLKDDIDTLKKGIQRGSELYANLRFDDEPFTPYQLALQEIKKLKEALKESLRYVETYGIWPGEKTSPLIEKIRKLIELNTPEK